MENTFTVYESFGLLAHEYEPVWSVKKPVTDAYFVHTCSLPYGYKLSEGALGDQLVEDVQTGECVLLTIALARCSDAPAIYFPRGFSSERIPLVEW